MSKQPEALRLAEFCDGNVIYQPASAELRRQHALIEEMREALKLMIGDSRFKTIATPDGTLWNGWAEKCMPTDMALDAACAALAKAEAQQ